MDLDLTDLTHVEKNLKFFSSCQNARFFWEMWSQNHTMFSFWLDFFAFNTRTKQRCDQRQLRRYSVCFQLLCEFI